MIKEFIEWEYNKRHDHVSIRACKKMAERVPELSVVIPTFNRAPLLKEAIESVLSQGFASVETIVVDDGSTDNTQEMLHSYQNKIQFVRQKNQGPERSRNVGTEIARGRYILYLDSDDILLPHACALYHEIIDSAKPALIVARGRGFKTGIDIDRLPATAEQSVNFTILKDFLSKRRGIWLSTSFLVVRREHLHPGSLFRTGTFPVDDLDFILRLGTLSPCVLIDNPVTVGYRIHESNSIHDVKSNLDTLHMILDLERKGEYPGGVQRKFDRLSIIGGHIQAWSLKGMKVGLRKAAFFLLIKGFHTICAILLKKAVVIAASFINRPTTQERSFHAVER